MEAQKIEDILDDTDEIVLCKCGARSAVYTFPTERHPCRRFWACKKRECNFFKWIDEEFTGHLLEVYSSIRKELDYLRDEHDSSLVRNAAVKAILKAKGTEIEKLVVEKNELIEVNEKYRDDYQQLFEEMGVLMMEIDTMKDRCRDLEVGIRKVEKVKNLYRLGWGIVVGVLMAVVIGNAMRA